VIVWYFAVALADIFVHVRHLATVAAGVGDVHADDDPAFAVGGELHVVRRAVSAVAHLHLAGLGIGRAAAGLLAVAFFPPFLLVLQLFQFFQRLLDAFQALAGGPLAGGLAAGVRHAGFFRFVFGLFAQLADVLAGLLVTLFERFLAAERTAAGIGPHPHAVLRDGLERDQPLMHQRGDGVGQQLVEKLAVRGAEIAEQVIVDAHAAANPHVGQIALAQAGQLPRAAD